MATIVEPSVAACQHAARRLLRGELVALPSETVYGIAGRTFDPHAIERIYAAKRRPMDNPLIAHVLDAAHARRLVSIWTETAQRLSDAFWPGPLTMILPRHPDVPAIAAGGRRTIAVRAPRHDVFRTVIARAGEPLSAPSANRSGHVSPTRAQHVADDFPDDDLLILDGGASVYGIESTVIDMTCATPTILRPGVIDHATLVEVLGTVAQHEAHDQLDSPGTSTRHYAPNTPCAVAPIDAIVRALDDAAHPVVVLTTTPLEVRSPHQRCPMPDDARAYAHSLYAALRRADACELERILIETVPDDRAWDAVRDRLTRASSS